MAILDDLLDRVRSALPDLTFRLVRLDDSGGDYRVLVIDENLAFRFPRCIDGSSSFASEIATLKLLRRHCDIQMPDYFYVDPAGDFAGYHFIPGVAMSPSRFHRMRTAIQTAVLRDLARLLTALHELNPSDIEMRGDLRRAWGAPEFIERGRATGLPLIANDYPELAAKVEAFYARYPSDAHPDCVVHGDLVGDHILLAKSRSSLAGIIDFGDVSSGDPAQDFLFFWSYGERAVVRLLDGYAPAALDPGILMRSRWAYGRYRIDQFWHALGEIRVDGMSSRAQRLGDLLLTY